MKDRVVLPHQAHRENHVSGWAEWQTAVEYLQTQQYEQAAPILQELQSIAGQNGDFGLSNILAVANQICLACEQNQREIRLHQQSLDLARERQNELQQQLWAMLKLIVVPHSLVEEAVTGRPAAAIAVELQRKTSPTLWQRVRSLLGDEPPPAATKPAGRPGTNNHNPQTTGTNTEAGEQDDLPAPKKDGQPKPEYALAVHCLGTFRVYDNGRLLDNWSGNKCKSIFKYMVAHRERPIHREILMDLFWPGDDPESARRNLYQAIYMLRQALQNDASDFAYVLCQESAYSLNPVLALWVDSETFEAHYKRGLSLEQQARLVEAINEYEMAESLYEGNFLAEDIYEEWPSAHRERLKHIHLDLLDRLSQHYWTAGEPLTCINYCLKILHDDNCREDVHRRLMLAYLRQEQRHLALRQYHRCVEALAQELDVDPMPATVELYQNIQDNSFQFPETTKLR